MAVERYENGEKSCDVLHEPLPTTRCLEVGVSYYLHRRSFCVEEGGLLLLDEFIGSLPDEFRKQHRHHTDGAVQIRFGCPEEHFLTPKHENTLLSLPDRLVRL